MGRPEGVGGGEVGEVRPSNVLYLGQGVGLIFLCNGAPPVHRRMFGAGFLSFFSFSFLFFLFLPLFPNEQGHIWAASLVCDQHNAGPSRPGPNPWGLML